MKVRNVALLSLIFLSSYAFQIVGSSYPFYCSDENVGNLIDNVYDTCIKDITSSDCANALHQCKAFREHNCCNCFGPVFWLMCSTS